MFSVRTGGDTMNEKKYYIKSKVRFIAFISILMILSMMIGGSLLGINNANAASMTEAEYQTVEVCYGDTLWDLAQIYCSPNQDVREMVYAICDLNEIGPADLYPGQMLYIPNKI